MTEDEHGGGRLEGYGSDRGGSARWSGSIRFKSGVNIMFGCNNFCSVLYCPLCAGPGAQPCAGGYHQRDRRSGGGRCCGGDALRSECKFLWQDAEPAGHVSQSFCGRVEQIDGLERIRFMTSHPKDLSDDLIRCDGEVQRKSAAICIFHCSQEAAAC